MTPEETANLLKAVLRRPVAYHRAFAEIAGKASAGLMLSQAWYWTPRTDNEDGWFYKTRAEWTEETGMTRTEQETARRRLVDLGLMEEALKGMPGKMHFRVNTCRLVSLLAENLPTERRKGYQQAGRKAANTEAGNPPTVLNTESTTETRSETTQKLDLQVFRFWQEHLNHPKAVFDSKRRKAVNARLREGHSVDDLITAVRGCKLSPHHMGQNEQQAVYDDLELICRDTTHVERFIARAESPNGNGYQPSSKASRTQDAFAKARLRTVH